MTQLACQTITWGPERLNSRYPDVVRDVMAAGFVGVETKFDILKKYREELPRLREETGVRFVAAHSGFDSLKSAIGNQEELGTLKAVLRTSQVEYVLVSYGPQSDTTVYTGVGQTLVEAQRALGDLGITVLFHNHGHEIEHDFDALKRICDVGGSQGIGLAVDFGWALRAKVDLNEFIRSLNPCIRYAHFKDFRENQFVELGTGDIGLENAVAAVKPLDLPWWIAEQDHCEGQPVDSATRNYQFLQRGLL